MAQDRSRAIILLIITAVLWSFGGLFIKLVNANPLAVASARSAIAVPVLLLFSGKPRFNWSYPQICAALAYSATTILFVTATKTTTAANAVLLQFTAPVYVALLAGWILRERILKRDWLTVFFVMGGMLMFFYDNLDVQEVMGNIAASVSGISFALFIIFMRLQKDGSPLESIILGNTMTALIGLPFLVTGLPDMSGWLFLLILGIVQLGIPYILFARAIKHATALEAILIPTLEPLLNPLWVFLLLGEAPRLLAVAGGLLVLGTITIRCISALLPGKAKPSQLPLLKGCEE